MDKSKSLVISMISAPASGKSTLATELFSVLKKRQLNVEYVNEYAKDLTWDGKYDILKHNQLLVSGMTFEKLRRLNGKVDIIVTDTSLLLGAVYSDIPIKEALFYYYNQFNNMNLFLEKPEIPFNSIGRVEESWKEVEKIENKILKFFYSNGIPFFRIPVENRLEKVLEIFRYVYISGRRI